jgi:hypothetical protein
MFEKGEEQIEQLQEKNDRLITLLSAERERQEKLVKVLESK